MGNHLRRHASKTHSGLDGAPVGRHYNYLYPRVVGRVQDALSWLSYLKHDFNSIQHAYLERQLLPELMLCESLVTCMKNP
jgi:hypothetical protein